MGNAESEQMGSFLGNVIMATAAAFANHHLMPKNRKQNEDAVAAAAEASIAGE